MKLGDRNVIASKLNIHGVRVFIPEKIRSGGVLYVVPYSIYSLKVEQSQAVIYSTKALLEIDVTFESVEVCVNEPFTAISLQKGVNRIIKTKGSKRSSNITLSKSDYYALLEA